MAESLLSAWSLARKRLGDVKGIETPTFEARLFVEAALRRMLGMADETRWRLPLAAEVRKKPGNASIQKAGLRLHADGSVRVQPLRGQESFRIAPLRGTHAWMLLPEDGEHLAAGSLVEALPPSHLQSNLLGSAEA